MHIIVRFRGLSEVVLGCLYPIDNYRVIGNNTV